MGAGRKEAGGKSDVQAVSKRAPCACSPNGAGPAWSVGSVPSLRMARDVCGDSAVGQLPGPISPSHACPSSPDPCRNGGSCSDGIGTFFCECLAGFRGPKCEEDINECASNPCKNGANCTDCVNSYTCTCPSGFSGIHCENNTPDCTERYSRGSSCPGTAFVRPEQGAEVPALPHSPGPVCGALVWSRTSGG